jgi:hypothetical protein
MEMDLIFIFVMKALIENADNMKLTSIYYRKKTKESYLSLNCDFHLNSNSTNNKKNFLIVF